MTARHGLRIGAILVGLAGLLSHPGRAFADGAVGGSLGLSIIDNARLDHRPVMGAWFLNQFTPELSLRLDLSYLSGDERFGALFLSPGVLGMIDTVRTEIVGTETSLSFGSALSYEVWKSPAGHRLRAAAGAGLHRRTAEERAVGFRYDRRQKDVSLQLFAALSAEWRIPKRPYFFLGEAKYSTFADFEQKGSVPLSDLEKDDLLTLSVGFGYRFASPKMFRPHSHSRSAPFSARLPE